jgi:hypothetical protein
MAVKTYYIDKFRLNGENVQIKFEPFKDAFFKVSLMDKKAFKSVSIPLLLESIDVLNSIKTLKKLKRNHEGSLESFGMVVAGAISLCMKFKRFN